MSSRLHFWPPSRSCLFTQPSSRPCTSATGLYSAISGGARLHRRPDFFFFPPRSDRPAPAVSAPPGCLLSPASRQGRRQTPPQGSARQHAGSAPLDLAPRPLLRDLTLRPASSVLSHRPDEAFFILGQDPALCSADGSCLHQAGPLLLTSMVEKVATLSLASIATRLHIGLINVFLSIQRS